MKEKSFDNVIKNMIFKHFLILELNSLNVCFCAQDLFLYEHYNHFVMKSTLQLNIRQIQCCICVWSQIICEKAKPSTVFSFAGLDCPALHTVHECCFMHKTSSACQEISSGVDEEGSLFSPASLFSSLFLSPISKLLLTLRDRPSRGAQSTISPHAVIPAFGPLCIITESCM